MNGANGGNIIYKFLGDTKDFMEKHNNVKEVAKGTGKIIGKSIVAGTTMAAAAVTGFVADATKKFADFEQLQGGLQAMMKGDADAIEDVMGRSARAYEDLQMSQNEYLQSFETSYMLVKNGLADEANAIEYTNKTLQLSADLFNTYGGSTEQYATAINWALKGTFNYVDNLNLGIKGTREGFVEAANASGILGRTIEDVSELTNEEIIDVIQAYAKEAGAWGRSTAEAGETITGSLKMVKASWSNLVNEFGKENGDIEGAFDNFMKSAETFGKKLFPVLERILTNVINYLPNIVQTLVDALPGFVETIIPPLIQSAVQVFQAIVQALPQLIEVLAQMLPGIIKSLITGLVQIVNTLAEQLPTLIPTIIDAILEVIPVLIDNLPLFIDAGVKLIVGLCEGLLNAIPVLLENTPKIISSIIGVLAQLPGKVFEVGVNLIKGLWNGIKNVKQWLSDKIAGLGNWVLDKVKGIFGIHSPSTEFAFIGKMNMTGLEEGMEDMQPEIQRTIDSLFNLSPNVIGSMNNTLSPTVIVNNNVTNSTDPLGQMVTNIKTFANGAKNDYNYGMGV